MARKKNKKECQMLTMLTNAEAEIMQGVWALYPRKGSFGPRGITVREVHGYLYPEGQKALTTVQTVMEILERKGFLKTEKVNRWFKFFAPIFSQEKIREGFVRREIHRLASRWFGGSLAALAEAINEMEKDGQLSEERQSI